MWVRLCPEVDRCALGYTHAVAAGRHPYRSHENRQSRAWKCGLFMGSTSVVTVGYTALPFLGPVTMTACDLHVEALVVRNCGLGVGSDPQPDAAGVRPRSGVPGDPAR